MARRQDSLSIRIFPFVQSLNFYRCTRSFIDISPFTPTHCVHLVHLFFRQLKVPHSRVLFDVIDVLC